ncbi:hypothetical protein [Spirosoma sp. KNUC1025]|uniref:hypothetical protein n=1 Tax=Spirosoma sp. KNUC1025 TaxID=2894082 RepID=UPI003862EA3D|nr:hypothetical protein LN737_19035 [Spirosoma sp. KNUC1025]
MRLLFTVLFFIPVILAGQSLEPTKGDKLIEIRATQPDSILYRLAGRSLLNAGYTFKADKESLTMFIEEKPLRKWPSYLLTSQLSVHNNSIRLTGNLRNTIRYTLGGASAEADSFPVEYRRGNTVMQRAGFLQLIEMAAIIQKAITGSVITYYSKP